MILIQNVHGYTKAPGLAALGSNYNVKSQIGTSHHDARVISWKNTSREHTRKSQESSTGAEQRGTLHSTNGHW